MKIKNIKGATLRLSRVGSLTNLFIMVYGHGSYRMPYKTSSSPLPPRIFDQTLLENNFPRINKLDDTELQNELLKRIEDMSPTSEEIESLNNIVNEITKICDSLICTPGQFAACQVEESRLVGSFKKGLMFRGHRTADVVVVLKTLPFVKSIEVLAERVLDGIKKSENLQCAYSYEYEITKEGFDIIGSEGRVKIRIATIPANMSKLDSSSHMPYGILNLHLTAIKHCRWFEDHCQVDVIKNVIKIIRFLRSVYPGMRSLTPWMIELLGNYVVMNTPSKEQLNESSAFRRALQLLSSGLLLKGSSGLPDPCDSNKRLHISMSFEKQDLLCLTAQGLLRILAHGGPGAVLSGRPNLLSAASMWRGVIVNPLDKAYEKTEEKEQAGEEMEVPVDHVKI